MTTNEMERGRVGGNGMYIHLQLWLMRVTELLNILNILLLILMLDEVSAILARSSN